MLLIPLILLFIITLFYVATKEGLEDKKCSYDKLSIKGDVDIGGNLKVKKQQVLNGGQKVNGLSKYNGKVQINPKEKDHMPDLSIGDGLSGFKKGDNNVMFTAKSNDIGGFDQGGMYAINKNVIEMGKGVTKQVDAGKIGYKTFSDGLDVIGASPEGVTAIDSKRKIKLWDNVSVANELTVGPGGLTVNGPVNMPDFKQEGKFGNVIELSPELTAQGKKEHSAGKIGYNVFANDSTETENLGIVGAGLGPRKIHMWDDVVVQKDLKVNNSIKVGNWTIFEDDFGMLRFSKDGVNKTSIVNNSTKQDGIGIHDSGNIYMTRSVYRGWIAEGCAQHNKFIRTGSSSIKSTKGYIQFNPPFESDIPIGKIKIVATHRIYNINADNTNLKVAFSIAIDQTIGRDGFGYYIVGMNTGTPPNIYTFEPGETFDWIAIASI